MKALIHCQNQPWHGLARDHEPESFGIKEPIAKSYLGQLVHPFRTRATVADEMDDSQAAPSPDAEAHRPTGAASAANPA